MAKKLVLEDGTDEFDLLDEIAADNRYEYNVLKLCEELAELQERLLKLHLKTPDKKPSKVDIAEEMGDVAIRMWMLASVDEELAELTTTRVKFKARKLYGYFQTGKFKGGV